MSGSLFSVWWIEIYCVFSMWPSLHLETCVEATRYWMGNAALLLEYSSLLCYISVVGVIFDFFFAFSFRSRCPWKYCKALSFLSFEGQCCLIVLEAYIDLACCLGLLDPCYLVLLELNIAQLSVCFLFCPEANLLLIGDIRQSLVFFSRF